MKKYLPVIAILALSIVTHFAFFGYPNETVFDEVHFGKFISGYFTHEYFFDIHPPLGKLLISGAGYITGFKPGFSFAEIGAQFPDNAYMWLRFLPSLVGTLFPIVIYFLALRLGFSKLASFSAGIFMALENSFIVQSRLILLDAFLLLFGFAALYAYLTWRAGKSKWYLLAAGVLAGMAVSIKWTGVSFLGIIGVMELYHLWEDRNGTALKRLHAVILCLVLAPALVYLSTFVIHLKLLTRTGPGDAFMTSSFRKTLSGSAESNDPVIKPLGLPGKIIELNLQMYKSNATLTATHPYSSKWYTWPFMQRPIYYWHKDVTPVPPTTSWLSQPKFDARIYFLGNPILWLSSTLAMIYLMLDIAGNIRDRKKTDFLPKLIVAGYIVNMLPFVGIARPMFQYHYMIGYVFAFLALIYFIDKTDYNKLRYLNKKKIFAVFMVLSMAAFIFFAPLTYGLPLSAETYNIRTWLPTWK